MILIIILLFFVILYRSIDLYRLIKYFFNLAFHFNPQAYFLTDIMSFEAIVVGFAVPLSFNTVSRISDRYHSEIISNKFMKERVVRCITPFLIINIVAIVVVRFLINVNLHMTVWRYIYYIILVSFIISAVLLWKFFNILKVYTIDIKYILKRMFKETEEYCKDIVSRKKQKMLDSNLGGIGDILVFATKQINKNEVVLDGFNNIEGFLKQLFSAKVANTFNRPLVPFSACLDQLLRVHKAAVESGNQEISRKSAYRITDLLKYLSKFPNNINYIRILFDRIREAQNNAIEVQDVSVYPLFIGWYAETVFDDFDKEGNDFDLSYLSEFNSRLIDSIKMIVGGEETKLFEYFVKNFIDQPHILLENSDWIMNIKNLIYQIDNRKIIKHLLDKFNSLGDSVPDKYEKEAFNDWVKELNSFKDILASNLNAEQKNELNKSIEKTIKYVKKHIKISSVFDIFTFVGAYCLFKNKPDYIRYMWEYNQPKDADGSWLNHNVFPSDISKVLDSLLTGNFYGYFFEGHHGSRIYFERYLLLLLANIMRPWKKNDKGNYDRIKNFSVTGISINGLDNIATSGLIKSIIEEAKYLKNQKEMLMNIGFNTSNIDELFDEKLIPFINSLKPKAEEEIRIKKIHTPISKKRVDEFAEEFVKAFKETDEMRVLFKKYNLYEDKTKGILLRGVKPLKVSSIDDKTVFLDKWPVDYLSWGETYGKNTARYDNWYIIKSIASECMEVKKEEFEKAVRRSKKRPNLIIIAENVDSYAFFGNGSNFIPKWHKDAPPDNLGFEYQTGWYRYKEDYVPVFNIFFPGINESFLLLLDKTKLGELVQYRLRVDKNGECKMKDMFCFNIQAFSESQKILDKFLKDPPGWLKEKGNKDRQKKYLLDKVWIQVYEYFVFKKHKNFKGYKLKLSKQ